MKVVGEEEASLNMWVGVWVGCDRPTSGVPAKKQERESVRDLRLFPCSKGVLEQNKIGRNRQTKHCY